MSRISYFRVSSRDQSIDAQRNELGGNFDKEFEDSDVSGLIPAAKRPGFGQLLRYIREGDSFHVAAIDRLGRDALDIQATVRRLIDMGVTVHIHGLGALGRGVGEIIVAVLAQVADMERRRIVERCESGRAAARASLAATGKTHHGKASLGRPKAADPAEVVQWRRDNKASLTQTVMQFGLSRATVSRYCAAEK
jgi:putative DNA-invertase from lambdoid prophage Rac